MGAIELYFQIKLVAEIILAGIGVAALIVYILAVIIGAKRK